MSRQLLMIAGLIAANCVVFGQALNFEFLDWDDKKFVVAHLQRFSGLTTDSIAWAFTNQENGWRTPLPYLSLFTDAHLNGLSSAGMHATNLLFHIASTVVLFSALRAMTGNAVPSFVVAILFAVHPLHVEPVVWVTGRWELMCGFFWIVGMWSYVRYCSTPGALRYAAVFVMYFCALLSKPMALTFPFALLLLDYWPLERVGRQAKDSWSARFPERRLSQLLIEKVPLFAVTGVALAISWFAKADYLVSRGMIRFSWTEKLLNAVQTYAICWAKTFCPTDLSFFYPHPALNGGFLASQVVPSALLLLLITAFSIALARRWKCLLVGWLWYLGVFIPAIGLLQVDHHARADRYTYLPLIGISVAVTFGAAAAISRWRRRHIAIVIAAFASLLVVAHRQAAYWQNSETLFRHGVAVDETNYKALTNLGNVFGRRGDFKKARAYYQRSHTVCPWDRSTVNNLAVASYRCGDSAEVCELLSRWDSAPAEFPARYLLPICLLEDGQAEKAVSISRRMLAADPENVECRVALGRGLAALGEVDQAEVEYRQILSQEPRHSRSLLLLSDLLIQQGRPGSAIALLDLFAAANPARLEVRNRLAWLLATHPDQRVRHGERAVRLAERICSDGGHRYFLLDTLAAAYAETNRFEDACRTIEQAMQQALQRGDAEFSGRGAERLRRYRAGEPWREVARSGGHSRE